MAPDGKHFATASLDGTTRVWSADLDRGNVILEGTLARQPEASFSPDGSKLVTVRQDHSAAIWDTRTGERLVPLPRHAKSIISAAFSHDGLRVATSSQDGTARIFDAASGAVVSVLRDHKDTVKSVAFGPGGGQVLTVSDDRTARLWDTASGSVIKILRERNTEEVAHALFVPGTGEIITAAYLDGVKVWNPTAERVAYRLDFPSPNPNILLRERAVEAIASPDGRTIIVEWSVPPSRYVIYEDRRAGKPFQTGILDRPVFRFEGNTVRAIAETFMSNTARIVDLTSRKEIARLRGHTNFIAGAAFRPDGRSIVTGSRDRTIRLWDTDTGAEIGRLPDDRPWGAPPIFTPDGKRLVIQNPDTQRTVLLNLDPVNFVPASARRDYICRERLVGAQAFTDQEMEDPVLRTRDDLRNPCRAFGPFAIEYYTRALGISRH
jgi:WD40 repeat protein